MSVHAVKWAWSQQVGNSTRKLVLVALADHSNSDGECWPSLARVAEFAECDERTVRRHIVALENGGFVVREGRRPRSDGYFGMRTYRLLMDSESTGQQCPPDNLSTGHESPCPPDTTDRVQRTLVSGKEPTTEPSGEPSSARDGDHTLDYGSGVPTAAELGRSLAGTVAAWVESKGSVLPEHERRSDDYRRLVEALCEYVDWGAEKRKIRSVVHGIICEYYEEAYGEWPNEKTSRKLRSFISEYRHPATVVWGLAEAIMHDADELADYARKVIESKLKAAS